MGCLHENQISFKEVKNMNELVITSFRNQFWIYHLHEIVEILIGLTKQNNKMLFFHKL